MRNVESHIQFAGRCAPRKVVNIAENLVLQALHFRKVSAANSQAGHAYVIIELMSTLWRVSLMFSASSHTFGKGVVTNNVLKALAVFVCMCVLDVILLPKITPKHLI